MIDFDSLVVGPLINQVYGEPFVFDLAGIAPFQANAVYDEAYQEIDLAGGTGVMTTGPAIGIRVLDFPRLPKQNDECTCQRTGVQFVMQKPQPDSHGGAFIKLNALGP